MALDIPMILNTVLVDYTLPWSGYHGIRTGPAYLKTGSGWPRKLAPRSRSSSSLLFCTIVGG